MSKQKPTSKAGPRTKSRRHGYRGYGSPLHEDKGVAIHYPRGFTGIEFPSQGSVLPERREELPEDVGAEGSDEDTTRKK